MAVSSATQVPVIALIGNPNTGKSTLFNALCGARQRVGNFPGCTVEKKVGQLRHAGSRIDVLDLPGTYSLSPRSPDEMVAVDVLLGRRSEVHRPDAILCIVDASNLERNLYLVSQVLELGLPTVLALNMLDIARDKGHVLDLARLRQQLGLPIVEVRADKRQGIPELQEQLVAALESGASHTPPSPFPPAFQDEVASLSQRLSPAGEAVPRYLVERLLLDTSGYLQEVVAHPPDVELPVALQAARDRLKQSGAPVPAIEALSRYQWVGKVLEGVVARPARAPVTFSDRIDGLLTHRVWGTLIFTLLMILVFQSIFTWAGPAMTLLEDGFKALGEFAQRNLPEGQLTSLLVDGVIAGVGGVLVFLPQILLLFFFLAILEDCGYMARAAYLMDKLLSRVGLSGKSFIPLLSSFACAIPGVMATRVIENRRDRLTTMLVAPLMSCSARLPVYTILIEGFIPKERYLYGWIGLPGLTMFAMYLLGIVVAVLVAWILKRTLLRGETPPFVMELPSYKWPSVRIVLWRLFESGWSFTRRAGTLILAMSILIWAALYYPRSGAPDTLDGKREQLEQSYLGKAGRTLEPVFVPLGWDWRIGSAAIASFPAREVVMSTLGIIYNLGGELDFEAEEERSELETALRNATWDPDSPRAGQPVYNTPVALSLMVFFALCAQCGATLAVIKRETNSWFWPIFTFVYMTTLAYLAAFVTYQLGMAILAMT